MALIKKDQAGSAPGYTWENDGDVVEVTDPELATELCRIPDGGFSDVTAEVSEPAPEKKAPAKKAAGKKEAAPTATPVTEPDKADRAEVSEPAPEDEKAVEE